MQIVKTVQELRHWVGRWHRDDMGVALVPTMGALHEAHLRLIDLAAEHGERVVVSIFVNPLQFGEGEDFDAYPRVLEDDARLLESRGTHLLFAPEVGELYPGGTAPATRVEVPGLSQILCGASRPGHFAGVATVVAKLFNLVQPDAAVFGEKDFQQLAVIRRMATDLNFPVEVIGAATVREADGLAMSSRNRYLTPRERQVAPLLYQTLQEAAEAVRAGPADLARTQRTASKKLELAGFRPDYVSIRRATDLAEPAPGDTELVILAAAWLGQARLIDNLRVGG